MILIYRGVYPHYEVPIQNNLIIITCGNRPSHKKTGETVKMVEVIEIEETNSYVPLDKSRISELSKWNFAGE